MEKQIKIVTGKIHSGKTTKLFTFLNSHKSVTGILAPIINGKRMLYDISTKELRTLEVEKKSDATISVGNYNFLIYPFNWANQKLKEGYSKNPEWLIIDEIGKLELDKKGLYNSSNYILKNFRKSETKIILVIRDYLVKQAHEFFQIDENEIEYLEL